MLKKSYLVLGSIIFCLLFSFKVNAATSTSEIAIPVQNGTDIRAYTQSYTGILASEIYTEGGETGDSYAVFEPTFNIVLSGMNQRYLNGYFSLTINVAGAISGYTNWTYEGMEFTRADTPEGVSVFLALNNYNYFRIYVIFDNYYNDSNHLDLGTFTQKHVAKIGDVTPLKADFLTSFTIYANSLENDQYIQNNRTTELLYSAIYQATGQQFTDILTVLNTIKNQDPVYYNQIITGLTAINSTLGSTNSHLLSILNELDLDFQQVQTILDLFPSYRTQVLQYWQELLQMNAAQSSAAAEMDNEYTNKESQSSQLVNGLGSLNLPSVDSNDFNILGNVDSNSKANFFGLIGLITNNSLITTILIIIVTGAIVGYALYGKK